MADEANDTVVVTDTVPAPEVLAAKRGWQTLMQGLGIDVVVAIMLVILYYLPQLESWDSVLLTWTVIVFTLVKSVIQAIAAWFIRRYLDKSGLNQGMPDVSAATGGLPLPR